MLIQNQIHRTLSEPDSLSRVGRILSEADGESRSAIGRRVCEAFGFSDGRGRPQLAGCMKALRSLEAVGGLRLPAPRCGRPPSAARRVAGAVPAAVSVPGELSGIGDVAVLLAESDGQRRIWSALMADEHPHGMATFAGCQLRYLVSSSHGWLSAVGFSASALCLSARDRWMGWSSGQRRDHLHRVVCLSRFLIRPGVRCTNLASHVLGRVLRRLPGDFEARYGFCPWLVETFVEPGQDGTSLRAANFLRIGQTAGRGRQDRRNAHAETVKTVYMYPLAPDWRRRLDVPFVDHAPVLQPGDGLNSATWAAMEFGGASLGDKRLSARLVRSAALLAEYPGRAICGNAASDRRAVDGFYRFIEQPQASAVTVENILAPHRARSIQRMRSQRTVLAIQDGTDLNFARRPHCEGLGIIGHNQTAAQTLGLHLHLTLAVNGEGLPLGVLRCGLEAPVPGKVVRRERTDGKKSKRWLDGFADIVAASRELSGRTRVVSVMDREADFFELFDAQRRSARVEVLVRARHDRRLDGKEGKLFGKMRKGEADGLVDVAIDRLTERKKTAGKKARPARSKRLARCEVRFRKLILPATVPNALPVSLSAVHVVETAPPEGEVAVQWHLLTSLPIESLDAAREAVAFYLQRWRVEDYFRVLKSGCRVEFLAFRTAERLQRAIAINSVIAWRIMLMTLLGRQVPDCDPELMFTDHELAFLRDYAIECTLPAPKSLGTAARLVAVLGGYQNRKHDPDPGNQIMWRGYERLSAATLGHRIAGKHSVANALDEHPESLCPVLDDAKG